MSFRRPRAATPPLPTKLIGFEVAKPVLERAFESTYGITLGEVFMDVDLAIGSYRRAVGSILPAMTKVAWQIKRQEIRKDDPSVTRNTFIYNLSRSSYEKNWGSTYKRPGICSNILATVFRILPKVGPFRALSFKRLTPETEKMYMASFNSTIGRYRELLSQRMRAVLSCRMKISTWGSSPRRGDMNWRMRLTRTSCTSCRAVTRKCPKNSAAKFWPSTATSEFPFRPRMTTKIGPGCSKNLVNCSPWTRTCSR